MAVDSRDSDGPVTNALGFDLEHWYTATLLQDEVEDPPEYLVDSVRRVLNLLDRYDTRATFFVVGRIADQHPDLVRHIAAAGHEIGTHGHHHRPVFDFTPEEFERELERSTAAISEAAGVDVVGYRAPDFSVDGRNRWIFDVLDGHGFRYDSSVFPAKTPMYGSSSSPVAPYRVTLNDPLRTPRADETPTDLVEFPPSVLDLGVRVPFGGGFYARVLPTRFLTWCIDHINDAGRPANLYFHPWELNPDVRRDDVPLHKRFVSFHGIERTEAKLRTLLDRFEWAPLVDTLGNRDLSDRGRNRADERRVQPHQPGE